MKLFLVLWLFSWSALQKSAKLDEYDDSSVSYFDDYYMYVTEPLSSLYDNPVSNITVYQQLEDRNNIMVTCTSEMMHYGTSCWLSVHSDQIHTLSKTACVFNKSCVFVVKVTPPVSITCLHGFGNITIHRSETYVLDHHEEGVSLHYIGFSSFIAIGLIIMTVAVIMTNIWSKDKGPTMTITNNDYEDA